MSMHPNYQIQLPRIYYFSIIILLKLGLILFKSKYIEIELSIGIGMEIHKDRVPLSKLVKNLISAT